MYQDKDEFRERRDSEKITKLNETNEKIQHINRPIFFERIV